MTAVEASPTGRALRGELRLVREERDKPASGDAIRLTGARTHNLKGVDLDVPFGHGIRSYAKNGMVKEWSQGLVDTMIEADDPRVFVGNHVAGAAVKRVDELDTAFPHRNDEIEPLRVAFLERTRRLHGDDHLQVAEASNNLAVFLMMERGKLVESRRHQLEALRIWRMVYPGGHSYIVTSLNNLGFLAFQLGELERAAAFYQEAIAMGTRMDAKRSTMTARRFRMRIRARSSKSGPVPTVKRRKNSPGRTR